VTFGVDLESYFSIYRRGISAENSLCERCRHAANAVIANIDGITYMACAPYDAQFNSLCFWATGGYVL